MEISRSSSSVSEMPEREFPEPASGEIRPSDPQAYDHLLAQDIGPDGDKIALAGVVEQRIQYVVEDIEQAGGVGLDDGQLRRVHARHLDPLILVESLQGLYGFVHYLPYVHGQRVDLRAGRLEGEQAVDVLMEPFSREAEISMKLT